MAAPTDEIKQKLKELVRSARDPKAIARRLRIRANPELKDAARLYFGLGGFDAKAWQQGKETLERLKSKYFSFVKGAVSDVLNGADPSVYENDWAVSMIFKDVVQAGAQMSGASIDILQAHRERLLRAAQSAAQQESSYFVEFLNDVKRMSSMGLQSIGDSKRIQRRIKMYVDTLDGVAANGMLSMLPPETIVWWELSPLEDHCEDCLAMAAGSPYTVATLPFAPRDGHTRCLSNCKCHLRFSLPTGERTEFERETDKFVVTVPEGTPDVLIRELDTYERRYLVARAKANLAIGNPELRRELLRDAQYWNLQRRALIDKVPELKRARRKVATGEFVKDVGTQLRNKPIFYTIDDVPRGGFVGVRGVNGRFSIGEIVEVDRSKGVISLRRLVDGGVEQIDFGENLVFSLGNTFGAEGEKIAKKFSEFMKRVRKLHVSTIDDLKGYEDVLKDFGLTVDDIRSYIASLREDFDFRQSVYSQLFHYRVTPKTITDIAVEDNEALQSFVNTYGLKALNEKGVVSDESLSAALHYAIGSRDINSALYEAGWRGLPGVKDAHIKQRIEALDAAIESSHRTPVDFLVWRGVQSKNIEKGLGMSLKSIISGEANGAVLTEFGYSSSSLSPAFAANWAIDDDGVAVVLRIVVPKGAPLTYLETLGSFSQQFEVLLPRGSSFVVSNVEVREGVTLHLRDETKKIKRLVVMDLRMID